MNVLIKFIVKLLNNKEIQIAYSNFKNKTNKPTTNQITPMLVNQLSEQIEELLLINDPLDELLETFTEQEFIDWLKQGEDYLTLKELRLKEKPYTKTVTEKLIKAEKYEWIKLINN